MAKRLTDINKWEKPWFRALTPKQKLMWLFLCDKCDHAGIWAGDFDLMSFQIGHKITEEDLLLGFGGRVTKHGNKFLLEPFFDFHYHNKKDGWSAKDSAQTLINTLKTNKTLSQGVSPPTHPGDTGGDTLVSPSIGIGISIGISTKGVKGEDDINSQLENLYNLYPRRLGKKKGLAKLRVILNKDGAFEQVQFAIKNYVAYCQRLKLEDKFIKHFDTFVNSWEDWLDSNAGLTQINKPRKIYNLTSDESLPHDADDAMGEI